MCQFPALSRERLLNIYLKVFCQNLEEYRELRERNPEDPTDGLLSQSKEEEKNASERILE